DRLADFLAIMNGTLVDYLGFYLKNLRWATLRKSLSERLKARLPLDLPPQEWTLHQALSTVTFLRAERSEDGLQLWYLFPDAERESVQHEVKLTLCARTMTLAA